MKIVAFTLLILNFSLLHGMDDHGTIARQNSQHICDTLEDHGTITAQSPQPIGDTTKDESCCKVTADLLKNRFCAAGLFTVEYTGRAAFLGYACARIAIEIPSMLRAREEKQKKD